MLAFLLASAVSVCLGAAMEDKATQTGEPEEFACRNHEREYRVIGINYRACCSGISMIHCRIDDQQGYQGKPSHHYFWDDNQHDKDIQVDKSQEGLISKDLKTIYPFEETYRPPNPDFVYRRGIFGCGEDDREYRVMSTNQRACCHSAFSKYHDSYTCRVDDHKSSTRADGASIYFFYLDHEGGKYAGVELDESKQGTISEDLRTVYPFLHEDDKPAPQLVKSQARPESATPHDHGAGLTKSDKCFHPQDAQSFGLLTVDFRASKASQLPCLEQSFQCAPKQSKVGEQCVPLSTPKQLLYSCKAKCGIMTAFLDVSEKAPNFANGLTSSGNHAYEMCGQLWLRLAS